jgi:hypothetical protein
MHSRQRKLSSVFKPITLLARGGAGVQGDFIAEFDPLSKKKLVVRSLLWNEKLAFDS